MKQITVYRGRTVIVPISFGYDISSDTFVSEIREEPNQEALKLATWDISFDSDGVDGELLLKLDSTVTIGITKDVGYMDIKRMVAGEPLTVFDGVIEVLFRDTVTA